MTQIFENLNKYFPLSKDSLNLLFKHTRIAPFLKFLQPYIFLFIYLYRYLQLKVESTRHISSRAFRANIPTTKSQTGNIMGVRKH